MGFNLTVAKGQQEGKSFDFEQAETNIGRTSDNDIVLYDPGVSRKHARIVERGGKYFAEDMGSANGTKVNGQPVKEAKELKDGDSLAVGPVVFAFKQAVADAEIPPDGPPPDQSTRIVGMGAVAPAADNATRIKAASSVLPAVKPRESGARKRPDLQAEEPTAALPKISGDDDEDITAPRGQDPAKAGAKASPARPLPARSTGASAAMSRGPGAEDPGTAADRLRRRRQYGDTLGGQLAYLWSDLSGGKKAAIAATIFVLVAGTGAGLFFLFKPQDTTKELPPEAKTLTRQPLNFAFGYGDNVDYERIDQKTFEFEFAAATRAVAVLRFMSSNISAQEVSIELNGSTQGMVPADTLEGEREIEQLLSPKDLKKGETNKVVFDNTKNPPGQETWSISNLSIEIIPIPDGTDEELTKIASDYAKKGKEFLDNRDIGSENLFRSWKNYRAAWLTLEAVQGTRPELYGYVRDQMGTVARDLDGLCRKMMLDVHRHLQLKQEPKAAAKLEEIDTYFPTNEHRCHNQAHALRMKLEL